MPQQPRNFGTGLNEPKDVIDEEQHIAMAVVAKVLGHRQRRMTHAEAAARWLVHLAEDHHHVRQHAGRGHVAVQLFTFATTLADAAEDADSFSIADHVVDHFCEQYRLADASPSEKPRLAAELQRHEHIDRLDAGSKYLGLRGAALQRRRRVVHGAPLDIR